MNCQDLRQLLSMAHDGHAAAKEAAAVTAHLRDCPACRRFQSEMPAFGGKLRATGEWEPAPRGDIRRRALERWSAEHAASTPRRQPWHWFAMPLFPARATVLGAGAALLLAALVGFAWWEQGRRGAPGSVIARVSPGLKPGSVPDETRLRGLPGKPTDDGGSTKTAVEKSRSPLAGRAAPNPRRRVLYVQSLISMGRHPDDIRRRPRHPQHLPPQRAPGAPGSPQHPTLQTAPARALPDEQYLDGRDPSLLAKWSAVGGKEQERLAAILKRLPPPADDFARIPYPQIAGLGGAGIAAAVQEYKDEAKVVDARLFRKVTLQDKGVALSDFCAELQEQTGVRLSASRAVADEKVTVFVKEEPARDVMRAVWHLFGYFWLRSGRDGEYRYELDQDLKSQLAEEEMRRADTEAALLQVDQQMAAYRPLLAMEVDQLRPLERRRIEELETQGKRPESAEIHRLFNLTYANGWGGAKLYEHLTPAERAALASGQEVVLRRNASEPEHRLPQEWADAIEQLWSYGGPRPRITTIRLRIDRSELGQLSLVTSLTDRMIFKDGLEGASVNPDVELARGHSPSAAQPENALANRGLRGDQLFQRRVTIEPESSCVRLRAEKAGQTGSQPYGRIYSMEPGPDLSKPHVFSSDVWEAVHRATGLPIVADYYTRVFPLSRMTMKQAPLFDALCRIGDVLGVRWRKEGDFVLARSTTYYWDRLKEVPNRYLLRWEREKRDRPGLSLESLEEMASLPDEELNSGIVAEAIEHCWGLDEWNIVSTDQFWGWSLERIKLRFLAALTPEHRRLALGPGGLPLPTLTREEQQSFLRVLQAMDYTAQREGGGHFTLPNRKGYFMVEYIPAGWYVWTPPASSPAHPWPHDLHRVAARTAAEALARARQTYPEAAADQVTRRQKQEFQAFVQIR